MPDTIMSAAGHGLPRERIEAAIEALIALLDVSEPDSDLEPQGDEEPSLGWTSTMAHGSLTDAELDDCDDEPSDHGIADHGGLEEQGLAGMGLAVIHAQMGRREPILGRFIPVAEYDKTGRAVA